MWSPASHRFATAEASAEIFFRNNLLQCIYLSPYLLSQFLIMAEFDPLFRPKIADSIIDVIGNTPLVRLGRTGKEANVVANILLKLESMEPCSSVKDRIAKGMILSAEARGEITPGVTTLVEPTSGNTGIGLAMVAAARGYELIVVMPSTLSLERRVMLKALGAKLVLTPGEKGMSCAIKKAQEILDKLDGKGFMLQQFNNADNPKTHRYTIVLMDCHVVHS